MEKMDSLVCSDENPNNVDAFEGARKGMAKRLRKKVRTSVRRREGGDR